MRSIWAGAISFGLVVIPVKLYAATEQRDITFRQVHRKDGARIQFRRVCTLDGEEVPYSDIAKGYELPTGDMVVLTDEDLADLPLVTAHRIEVLHFAPSAQVEPIYAAKSYYLEPESAGTRAYVLFRDALEASGKVAVAKVALRQREALAALRVREGIITLETLLWPDEVRQPDFAFLDEDIEVRSQELKMAASLIDTMTEDFEPDQYHDTYREALEAVVQAKVEGNDVVRPAGLELPGDQKTARRPDGDPAGQRRGRQDRARQVRRRQGGRRQGKRGRQEGRAGQDENAPPGQRMTEEPGDPIPHWPGQLVSLGDHQVFVRSVPDGDPGELAPVETARVEPAPVEPALCVHGLEGSSRNWTDLMDLLRPALACQALDLPGFGDSPPRPDGRYSIAALAQTVIALIEKQKRGPVHLIGNSLGGAVCVKVAATRPGLIRTLTLISPALPDARPRMDLLRFPVISLPGIGTWLFSKLRLIPPERRVADVIATCFSDPRLFAPARFAAEVAELARRDSLDYAAAALAGSAKALTTEVLRAGGRPAWRDAARIIAPSLVIYGSHDRVVDPRNAGRAAHAFRNARIVVLPRTGHVAQMERPGLVAAEIGIMLAAVRQDATAGRAREFPLASAG